MTEKDIVEHLVDDHTEFRALFDRARDDARDVFSS